MPGSGTAGMCGRCVFSMVRNCQTISRVAAPFCILRATYQSSTCPMRSPAFVGFFICSFVSCFCFCHILTDSHGVLCFVLCCVSWIYWPSVYLPWGRVCLNRSPNFLCGCLFLQLSFESCLSSIGFGIYTNFLPGCSSSFHSLSQGIRFEFSWRPIYPFVSFMN